MVEPHGARSSDGVSTLAGRVTGLAEAVAAQRSGFDSDGRLPDDLFDELATLGLFRLWLPAALGGPELSALEFMDVVEAAAGPRRNDRLARRERRRHEPRRCVHPGRERR